MEANVSLPFRFFDLPFELRYSIFTMIFKVDLVIDIDRQYTDIRPLLRSFTRLQEVSPRGIHNVLLHQRVPHLPNKSTSPIQKVQAHHFALQSSIPSRAAKARAPSWRVLDSASGMLESHRRSRSRRRSINAHPERLR